MGEEPYIEKHGDQYYIRGTRITVHDVADVLDSDDEMDLSTLAEEWGVEEAALEDALEVYDENEDEIRDRRRQRLTQ